MKLFFFLSVLNVLKILLTFCLEGLSVSTEVLPVDINFSPANDGLMMLSF